MHYLETSSHPRQHSLDAGIMTKSMDSSLHDLASDQSVASRHWSGTVCSCAEAVVIDLLRAGLVIGSITRGGTKKKLPSDGMHDAQA